MRTLSTVKYTSPVTTSGYWDRIWRFVQTMRVNRSCQKPYVSERSVDEISLASNLLYRYIIMSLRLMLLCLGRCMKNALLIATKWVPVQDATLTRQYKVMRCFNKARSNLCHTTNDFYRILFFAFNCFSSLFIRITRKII